jgi:hypothetical protein
MLDDMGVVALAAKTRTPAPPPVADRLAEIMPSLPQRAMLARTQVRYWRARKTDSKIAREVAEQHGGDADMHWHRRRLLAKSALAEIEKIASQAQSFHEKNTSPWTDRGPRLLATKNFIHYKQEEEVLKHKFYAAVAAFLPNYPTYIEEARTLLGDDFNEEDYPSPAVIEARFGFDIRIMPVPKKEDFRIPELGPDEEARIREEIESYTREAVQGVVRDMWQRIFEHVNHMVDGLTAYNEREEKRGGKGHEGTFKDSLVENLKELVDLLPKINVLDDPDIEKMRLRVLRQLCQDDADTLRKSPLTRNDVLAKAQAIRDAVADLI